jgi:hypothetical protein
MLLDGLREVMELWTIQAASQPRRETAAFHR